jgi:hypothetical protein
MGSRMLFAAVKPKILVNGYEMPVWGWGRTVLPLTAVQYLHVYVPYFFPRLVPRTTQSL